MDKHLERVAIPMVGIVILAGAAATGVVLGRGSSKLPHTLTAQRIEVIDQAGIVRLVLGIDDSVPTIRLLTSDGRREILGLRGTDQMSSIRAGVPGSASAVSMGIEHFRSPVIRITNEKGATLFVAGASNGQDPMLVISRGEDRVGPGIMLKFDDSDRPCMEVRDDEGKMVWTAPPTSQADQE